MCTVDVKIRGVRSFIGMMPGLGSSVACFVAYGEEKNGVLQFQKKWGTGCRGNSCSGPTNNAVSGPSMIPLLTLGIPGSQYCCGVEGVFLIHGITVGSNF